MNKEIEKGKWIPQTNKNEKFPGRNKIPYYGKKSRIFRVFGRTYFV